MHTRSTSRYVTLSIILSHYRSSVQLSVGWKQWAICYTKGTRVSLGAESYLCFPLFFIFFLLPIGFLLSSNSV